MSTKSTVILTSAIVLFWFISIQTSLSQVPTTTISICEGSVSLSLSPSYGFVGDTITASVGNLKSEGCIDKRVYVRESSCQGLQYCSCLPNRMAEDTYGCLCTFRAPSTPYISGKGSSHQSTFTYYACVDLDDDGIYDEALGEQDYTSLLVYSRYTPLSLVTESIFIIITLGVLLVITVIVFRMSLRRR